MCNIPVILSTGSLFNFDLDTVMALAAETGFDGIELMIDWRRDTQLPEHLQRLVDRHKLPILAVHSPFVEMHGPGWPSEPVASIKQSVGLAQAVGAQTVVVHPPRRWVRFVAMLDWPNHGKRISLPLPLVGPGKLGQWLLQELPHYQAKTPVKLAVENMPCYRLGRFKLNPHHFSKPKILNQFQYLTLDTTHVGTRDIDLMQFYERVQARVVHIHLSNFNGQEHQLPGDGVLPLSTLLDRLAKKQFKGLVSLELNPVSLQAHNTAKLRKNLQTSLDFCRQGLSITG